MEELINVVINGERYDLPEGARVRAAVEATGVDARGRGLAVAVDGEVVPRRRWDAIELENGQRVEIVGAVQGG